MEKMLYRKIILRPLGLLALVIFLPAMADAQPDIAPSGPPPIAAPLVREGDLAARLSPALGLGTTDDEVEAENRLADAGISPRNGWIADYPVTPDIIGELQQAVGSAADDGKVPLAREEALRKFNDALAAFRLLMTPYSPTGSGEPAPSDSENYPNPSAVSNYYYNEGPPIVTSYAPPPDFYYLYAWVPFPFWWSGFWFPGFFVLHDFHRTIIVNRRPVYVSNHFRDVRDHRVLRIDPTTRFQGRTFGGIGASRLRGFLPTGVPRSEQRIFNNPPPRNFPRTPVAPPRSSSNRSVIPSAQGGSTTGPIAPRVGRTSLPAAGGAPVMAPHSRSVETIPSPRGMMATPPPRGGEAVRPFPLHGGRGTAARGYRH